MNAAPRVSISVVSHNQGCLVASLLTDLSAHLRTPHELILTSNVPETLPFQTEDLRFHVRVLRNSVPKGFGANHNAAFRAAQGEFFCVMNPDIRISSDPFPALIDCLRHSSAGLAAPVIRNSAGAMEDSARRFPTPWVILRKALAERLALDYSVGSDPIYPDWVAGMFMLFPRDVYSEVGGFDERYFLYYEDVDLCARLALSGKRAVLCPSATVFHEARRESRRNLRYMRWHLSSMLRFFFSASAARIALRKLTRKARGAD